MGILKVMEQHLLLGTLLSIGQLAMMLGLVILALILLIYYWDEIFAAADRSGMRRGRWFAAAFLNPGMILFYAAAGALFFVS